MKQKDKKYLKFIREHPCIITGQEAEPHHVRCLGECGTSLKPPDYYAIPLRHDKHIEECHRHGEKMFFENEFIDPAKEIIKLMMEYIEINT